MTTAAPSTSGADRQAEEPGAPWLHLRPQNSIERFVSRHRQPLKAPVPAGPTTRRNGE